MAFYAKHNLRADLARGNRGFLNSWEVSRFDTKQERDSFVSEMENKNALACTRTEAVRIWRNNYEQSGKAAPTGGLFAPDQDHFWNERNWA